MPNGIALTETGIIDKIIEVVPKILGLGTTVFEYMTQNELTLVMLGVTFVGVGFGIVGMMLHAASHARRYAAEL